MAAPHGHHAHRTGDLRFDEGPASRLVVVAGEGSEPRALVLSLHGAAVQALNQVNSYARKDWCHIVAPTNRRPYGFDWEDWGRLDALEVLEHARKRLGTDPRRTYLTAAWSMRSRDRSQNMRWM